MPDQAKLHRVKRPIRYHNEDHPRNGDRIEPGAVLPFPHLDDVGYKLLLRKRVIEPAGDLDDLTELSGIGDDRADDLRQSGIVSFLDLATASAEKVAAVTNAGEIAAVRWVEAARERAENDREQEDE